MTWKRYSLGCNFDFQPLTESWTMPDLCFHWSIICCALQSTLTRSSLSPRRYPCNSLSARSAESGSLNSQKPKACNLPEAPWTRFQLFTVPHFIKICRTSVSVAFSEILPTNTVTGGPTGASWTGTIPFCILCACSNGLFFIYTICFHLNLSW